MTFALLWIFEDVDSPNFDGNDSWNLPTFEIIFSPPFFF